MMIPLFEKYRPNYFSEISGQQEAIEKIKNFFSLFEKKQTKKRAILFYGPAGIGKTTIAHVSAKEMNYELFELNASDLRNKKKLEEIMKPATEQRSLFSKGKIILVDEVDGVTATDRGGLPELITLIEKTHFPIVITCNDIWQQKFSSLRSKCELVKMKDIPYATILSIITKITIKEQKEVNEEIIKEIAIKSKGDLRAAINDLQSIINNEKQDVKLNSIDIREKETDIFNALKKVFKEKPNQETINIYDSVSMEIDQISLWIEKNIPLEYKNEELVKAYESLSKADVFKGRIYRQQHWRFLVYQNFFLSAGISAAKKQNKNTYGFTKYNPPSRILKIWMANQKNLKKKSISSKYAEITHTSKKRALRDFMFISLILDEESISKLDLDEKEREYLKNYKLETIQNIKNKK